MHYDGAGSDSDSSLSSAYEAMFEMPSAFHKPLTATRRCKCSPHPREVNVADVSFQDVRKTPSTSDAASSSEHSHALDAYAPCQSQQPQKTGKGKYKRGPGRGIWNSWKGAAEKHMGRLREVPRFSRRTRAL
eukprot:4096259-Pleurochrysis_carterae.AAC.1